MGRLWNRYIRWVMKKISATGLEQELNQNAITGELVFPEIAAVARQMATEGIVLLKNRAQTLPVKSTDRMAVFGRCAVNYFTVGYGSGGDVIAPYQKSLMDGLRENGVHVYEPLAQQYARWCLSPRNEPDEGFWGNWPMNYPEMPLKKKDVAEAAANSDLALVVIGRAAGEDRENRLKKGSYYLTDREMAMLDMVTAHFDRVAVILDCGNVIDMRWTERYGDRIGAIVYAWQGGMESGTALADILTGKQSPSGALTDSIAREYTDYPSSTSFGGKEFNSYTEDIYVGYRYFETFAKDKVLYPFGYGLSYTSFRRECTVTEENRLLTLQVQVENTGSCRGKHIVQAYLGLPCGKLGNPGKILAGFAKTRTLEPGECQSVTIKIDLRDFASYDDSGITGYPFCFVLEPGEYRLEVGSDVRSTQCVLTMEITASEIVRQVREATAVKPGCGFDRMVNRDGKLCYEPVPTANKDLKAQILAGLPQPLPKSHRQIPFSEVLSGDSSIDEFVAQLSSEELDQLTHGQGKMNSCYGVCGNAGAFGGVTDALRELGLPAIITADGPSGVRIRRTVSLLPCGTALASSFNPEGVELLYSLVSREMAHFGVDMLLAPGMNIHRNPLCGRNFEYYSEDPCLTGRIAAAAIRGIQSTGRSSCPKHFACNNQETRRNRNDSRVSERALREIYLKGFEIALRESEPLAIMTSYNKVNGVWSHYHYELVTRILRQEWGYQGLVITDWWMQEGESGEFPRLRNDACRIRAQVDVLMPGEIGKKNDPKAHTLVPSLADADGVSLAEAQRCAKNVVRFILKTKGGK